MNSKDKVEILAPCGSLETLKLAINCGANACYLGLNNFGARAFAPNFSHEEFKEAIRYAHLRNVKVYVTLNTLYNEDELTNVMKEVAFLYENDVDALIIQDLGLLHLLSRDYPDLEVHISTQMHIHNTEGVRFFQNFKNVKRIVLARETPLSVIAECQRLGLDIEIFAYGALCVSYSGQCLMSSFIHQRSGNKGMCSQNCRYRYDAIDKKSGKTLIKDEYLLSMKDLNIINELPELLKLNIASIKIEGRMKRSEYVCLVTKTFKEAVDAYYQGQTYKLSKERLNQLKLLFNREFTTGLINGANKEALFNHQRPNHMGLYLGKVIGFNKKRVKIKLALDLNQNDGIRFIQKNDVGLCANFIYQDGLLVNKAKKGEVVELEVSDYIEADAYVVKTTDVQLLKDINEYAQSFHQRLPIDMHCVAKVGQPLRLTITFGEHKVCLESSSCCEKAQKSPTSKKRIGEQLSKINDSVYTIEHLTLDGDDDIFIAIKIINDLRKEAIAALDEKRLAAHHRLQPFRYEAKPLTIIDDHKPIVKINDHAQYEALKNLPIDLFSEQQLDNCSLSDPIVNEKAFYPASSLRLVNEIGGLMQKGTKIAGPSLNIANSYALEFILQYCPKVIVSSELSDQYVQKMISAFVKRVGQQPNVYTTHYTKINLMHIKGDFIFEDIPYEQIVLKDAMKNNISIYKDSQDIKHLYSQQGYYLQNSGNVYIQLIDESPQEAHDIVLKAIS
ncbi:MAG: U32 family peptidase [Erysipelotrichaceae bacterium]|nr:U32 family peptidase [Erysipelotrichaceae bacterium]